MATSSLQRAAQSRDPGPHDYTGRRATEARALADQNAEDVDAAVREIRDKDTALVWVTVAGRSARFPLPREVYNELVRSVRH